MLFFFFLSAYLCQNICAPPTLSLGLPYIYGKQCMHHDRMYSEQPSS